MNLREEVEKNGSITAAARARRMPRTTFRRWLNKEREEKITKPKGISEEELLIKHSPEHKILNAARQIAKGRFIPEPEFIRSLHVKGGYKYIVSQEQFEKYRGKASGIVYWGEPSRVAVLKDEGVLA